MNGVQFLLGKGPLFSYYSLMKSTRFIKRTTPNGDVPFVFYKEKLTKAISYERFALRAIKMRDTLSQQQVAWLSGNTMLYCP